MGYYIRASSRVGKYGLLFMCEFGCGAVSSVQVWQATSPGLYLPCTQDLNVYVYI